MVWISDKRGGADGKATSDPEPDIDLDDSDDELVSGEGDISASSRRGTGDDIGLTGANYITGLPLAIE